MTRSTKFKYHPLTPVHWDDFVKLFGKKGAYGGCWCMFWHLTRAEFARGCGEHNKQAMHQMVLSGKVPGILIYKDKQPVAWCAVAPREAFSALNRSRIFARMDDQPVWSIVCFFIDRKARGQGILRIAIQSALDYARRNGTKIVEAYPTEPQQHQPAVNVYRGVASVFRQAGFREVLGRSSHYSIFRLTLS